MAYIDPSIINNLYKDFIGAQTLTDRLSVFYEGKQPQSSFPPYNIIETSENNYAIEIALAGYTKSEISLENGPDNTLIVKGEKTKTEDMSGQKWIWNGIAQRNFERRFLLETNIKVTAAEMADGILTISLVKLVPEKTKPSMIAIK
jgi:molecular chaperone IbpA